MATSGQIHLRGAAMRIARRPFGLSAQLLWIGGLALVVRVVYVLVQQRWHVLNLGFDAGDARVYRALAESLRNGHYAYGGQPSLWFTPGYPLFLAALYTFGRSTTFIGIVQCLLGVGTVVLLADIARRAAGPKAAWVTGLIGALYPVMVFWTGFVLSETLYCFLLVLGLWLVQGVVDRPHLGAAAAAGAVFGAASLTRPVALLFALVLVAIGLVRRRLRVPALVGLAGLALLMAPWVVRNAVVMHSFVPTSQDSSYILWRGNHPGANAGYGGYIAPVSSPPGPPQGLPFGPGASPATQATKLQNAALSWMTHHPGRVIELIPAKLWNMMRPLYVDASTLNVVVTLATYPALLLLGVAGLVLLIRQRELVAAGLLGGYALYTIIVHSLTFATIRYRVPLDVMMTVPAGVAGAALLAKLSRRWRLSAA